MGFRNIRAPYGAAAGGAAIGPPGTQVLTWVDAVGQTEPLAVWQAQGLTKVNATIASANLATLLSAPPTNFGYHLALFVGGDIGVSSGDLVLFDGSATFYGVLVPAAPAVVPNVITGVVAVFNGTSASQRVTLCYDLVRVPFVH